MPDLLLEEKTRRFLAETQDLYPYKPILCFLENILEIYPRRVHSVVPFNSNFFLEAVRIAGGFFFNLNALCFYILPLNPKEVDPILRTWLQEINDFLKKVESEHLALSPSSELNTFYIPLSGRGTGKNFFPLWYLYIFRFTASTPEFQRRAFTIFFALTDISKTASLAEDRFTLNMFIASRVTYFRRLAFLRELAGKLSRPPYELEWEVPRVDYVAPGTLLAKPLLFTEAELAGRPVGVTFLSISLADTEKPEVPSWFDDEKGL